mgnify:CR=1 FL=1
MLNKIVLQGRLCYDPELRHTQSGAAVSSFTLAVDRDFKSHSGERETDFVNCTAWKSVAEFTARYFSRGRMAIVEGRLQSRKYTDKDGNNRTAYEVVASSVYFCDSKKESDPLDKLADDAAPVAPAGEFVELTEDDGELPF